MPCGRHCDNPRVSWDDRDGGDGGQTDPLFQRDPLLDGSWAQADHDGPAEPPLTPIPQVPYETPADAPPKPRPGSRRPVGPGFPWWKDIQDAVHPTPQDRPANPDPSARLRLGAVNKLIAIVFVAACAVSALVTIAIFGMWLTHALPLSRALPAGVVSGVAVWQSGRVVRTEVAPLRTTSLPLHLLGTAVLLAVAFAVIGWK